MEHVCTVLHDLSSKFKQYITVFLVRLYTHSEGLNEQKRAFTFVALVFTK